jgi:Flp pilus assembly protein TadG
VRVRRRRTEAGAAALVIAVLLPLVFLGAAAFAIDISRWYLERQKLQSVADAAAMAAVPYMPYDLAAAAVRAREVTARNGYDDADPDIDVAVSVGDKPSQLRVVVTHRLDNTFGSMIGVSSTVVNGVAVADYQGPAPMGSPCNTFGNEPSAGSGASSPIPSGTALGAVLANCDSLPQFWGGIQGVRTNKSNGDRFMNTYCSSTSTHECTSSANLESDPMGYVWVVRVQPTAINQPITVQLYDPAYINGGDYLCSDLPSKSDLNNNMNPFVTTDGKSRYSNASDTDLSTTGAPYCNGDFRPADYDSSSSSNVAPTTTFVLREQTDTLNPKQAPVIAGCVRQYAGRSTAPTVNSLKSTSSSYNAHLAQIFHNWTRLCTFTPTRAGDYYLQVRTNVKAAGSAESVNTHGLASMITLGNATASAATGNSNVGVGNNTFSIRAVTAPGLEEHVSVSGYSRMPIFANANAAVSEFNLIRVLPGAAGKMITFSFFDVADSVGATGAVKVIPPTDATGTIVNTPFPTGCKAKGGYAGAGKIYDDCRAPVTNGANNAELETLTIPIPSDYSCNFASNGGCWYKVEVSLSGQLHDFTTWEANVNGDPVRLIE